MLATTRAIVIGIALGLVLNGSNAMDVHYAVTFTHGPPVEKLSSSDEVCEIAGYNCVIPETPKGRQIDAVKILSPYELEVQKKEAISLIGDFNTYWRQRPIVSLHHGYWDYTLVINEFLFQNHFEDVQGISDENKQTESYKSLAASYSLFQVQRESVESDFELITLDSGLKYVTQNIEGGQECDLTGLPRSTIIKYLCNPDADSPILSKVEEWRTCAYMATLESDWFCSNNSSSAWSQETSNEELEVKCVLYDDPTENDGWEFTPPLNLWKYKYSPLAMGVFFGHSKEKNDVDVMLLNKEFYLHDATLDEFGRNDKWDSFLQMIGAGFGKLIKSELLRDPSDLFAVSTNDIVSFTLPLYDLNRMIIGSVLIEQVEGNIVAYMTNAISFDYEQGNWIHHSQAASTSN